MFGDLSKEKLCKLSLLMTEEYFTPSHTIIRQGQPMSSCYIIASGKVGQLTLDSFRFQEQIVLM